MKKEDLQALREKSVEELQQLVTESREQLLKGRISQAVENEPQGMSARRLRRAIARYLTIIGEKQPKQKNAEVQA